MTRVALVTGGGQGIGRATAERLAKDGIEVVVADIRDNTVRETVADLTSQGARATGIQVDIGDEASVIHAFDVIRDRYGKLDILVNNAAIIGIATDGYRPPLADMPLSTWSSTIHVNVTGTFLMCRGAIPLLRRGNDARIVNVASLAGRMHTRTSNGNYTASKAAVIGLSRALAAYLGASGVTVNCIAPARVPTPMTLSAAKGNAEYFKSSAELSAIGRVATPNDMANAIAFLCSDKSKFITGAIVDVNGGFFMP